MKIVKRVALLCACSFLTYWLGSVAACEYYTYRYREAFENVQVHDIGGIHPLKEDGFEEDIKVLEYTDEHAVLYVKSSSSGNLYYFDRGEGGGWTHDTWDTVWSLAGSADGFVWPYIR